MALKYAAFDDKVVFHMLGFKSLANELVVREILDVFPGYPDTISTNLKQVLNFFMFCVPETLDIEFDLTEDDHPALLNLRRFWQEWSESQDYVFLFHRFTQLIDTDVGTTWWKAHEAHRPTRLTARPELQVLPEEISDPLSESDEQTL